MSKQYLTLSGPDSHQLFTVRPRGSREPSTIYSEAKMKGNIENGEYKSKRKSVCKTSFYSTVPINFPIQTWCSQEKKHLIIQRWQPDEASKFHSGIPSGIRHDYHLRPSQLHRRQDLDQSHRELQASSSCVTSRSWGAHTPGTIPHYSEIANSSQGNLSGDILL